MAKGFIPTQTHHARYKTKISIALGAAQALSKSYVLITAGSDHLVTALTGMRTRVD